MGEVNRGVFNGTNLLSGGEKNLMPLLMYEWVVPVFSSYCVTLSLSLLFFAISFSVFYLNTVSPL